MTVRLTGALEVGSRNKYIWNVSVRNAEGPVRSFDEATEASLYTTFSRVAVAGRQPRLYCDRQRVRRLPETPDKLL